MSLIEALQFIVTVVLAIITARQVYVTNKLDQRLYRLNSNLDQRVQRLHRAREAVIQQHKAYIFLLEYVQAKNKQGKDAEATEIYFEKKAEWSAYAAELRGLAFAIDDAELLSIVNNFEHTENPEIREMNERGRSQKLHTRISQLLLAATADAPTSKRKKAANNARMEDFPVHMKE